MHHGPRIPLLEDQSISTDTCKLCQIQTAKTRLRSVIDTDTFNLTPNIVARWYAFAKIEHVSRPSRKKRNYSDSLYLSLPDCPSPPLLPHQPRIGSYSRPYQNVKISVWSFLTFKRYHCAVSLTNSPSLRTLRLSYLTCAPPAALTSCAAARRVQYCDSRPPVLVRQYPGLSGRQLSARRRHSNTRCQSDAQQFWRHDLCRRRTAQFQNVGCHTASSGGYWRHFHSDSETTGQCELFLTAPNRNILTYLLT